MSHKLFVLCLSLAAALTCVRYVWQVEGTKSEKIGFFWRTGKQVLMGMPKYKGRHFYNRRLPVTHVHGIAGLA